MEVPSEKKKDRMVLSEINVTPFVDVMLVLLIIFMVTAPMMQQGLDIELPETVSGGVSVSDEPFILVIKKNKDIFIGSKKIPISQIGKKTADIVRVRRDKQVYIQADKSVEYGVVAETLAEIRAVGLYQVSLITTSKGR